MCVCGFARVGEHRLKYLRSTFKGDKIEAERLISQNRPAHHPKEPGEDEARAEAL